MAGLLTSMPPAPETLDSLMARLARGDRAAFTGVFDLLWSPLLRFCHGLLKHEADASDAAQEAMHKILERASDYDPARPAMPWAMAIAAWECRTVVRRRTRRREAPEEHAPEAGSDPEADFLQRDLMAAAMEAMGELSATDREALVATFWEEAASVSGAPLRKRRQRALERLRLTFRRLYGLS